MTNNASLSRRALGALAGTSLSAMLVGGCTTSAPVRPSEKRPSSTPVQFSTQPATSTLHLIHVGDTEAGMLADADTAVGGVARARAVIDALTAQSGQSLVVHSGDTMIPAPELSVEVVWPAPTAPTPSDTTVPDATTATATATATVPPKPRSALLLANNELGLQAAAVGNHDFDLGEAFFADAVKGSRFPFLSANLEVTGGPLANLLLTETHWLDDTAAAGKILRRGKACLGTRSAETCSGGVVGVVGASPETLRALSAGVATVSVPADVSATVRKVQAEVDALRAEGMSVVVLLSHRQGVRNDLQLIEAGLLGVDVIVSGGGENVLADAGDRLLEGTTPDPICAGQADGCYPLWTGARDGAPVAIVATDGDLKTVGALHISFDDRGIATGADAASRPWIIDEETVLATRATVSPSLLDLEQRTVAALAPLREVVGRTPVYLEGSRELVRNHETNLGSLSADALLLAGVTAARTAGAAVPVAAFRNGGAVRASIGTVTPGGRRDGKDISLLDVKTALRFDSRVVNVTLSHAVLRETVEAALIGAGTSQGRFPQVSREVHLVWSPAGVDQQQTVVDGKGAGVACPGTRLVSLVIDTAAGPVVVVDHGETPTPGAPITVTTIDYLRNGGDGWFPTRASDGATVVSTEATEQSAFIALVGTPDGIAESLRTRGRLSTTDVAPPAPSCAASSSDAAAPR